MRFLVGDAQALELPPASVDQTLALLVMNFILDPAKAAREMVRVTRPGGAVTAAVWDYGDGMEMLRVFWDEAVALDPAIWWKIRHPTPSRGVQLDRSCSLIATSAAQGKSVSSNQSCGGPV